MLIHDLIKNLCRENTVSLYGVSEQLCHSRTGPNTQHQTRASVQLHTHRVLLN